MPWYGWLSVAVSVVGYVASWRGVFRAIYLGGTGEWSDFAFCVFFATLFTVPWPLWALGRLLRWSLRAHSPEALAAKVGGRTRAQKEEARVAEEYERELRIRQMERELGIIR